jgi:tRNA pseudouridine55 synthase
VAEKKIINGWLCIDKPAGLTSTQVVTKVKKLLYPKKIGHAGTLDPFATGMLLLAMGEATKTVVFAMNNRKSYAFTVRFGEERDSLDVDGEILEISEERPREERLKTSLNDFLGDIIQTPPRFSAIKVSGQRAYNLARAGQEFFIPPRKVTLYKITCTKFSSDLCSFEIDCGKGFYVRSLARDICVKSGVIGYVESLRRTKTGVFKESDMISLDCLEKVVHNGGSELSDYIRPTSSVLDDILVYEVSERDMAKIRFGQKIFVGPVQGVMDGEFVATFFNSEIVAICIFEGSALIPKRIFNF